MSKDGNVRAKIAIGVAATVLAALAVALVIVLESPGTPPSLGQGVLVDEQGSDRRSAPAKQDRPNRPKDQPAQEREPATARHVAPPTAPESAPSPQPVPAPGGDERDEDESEPEVDDDSDGAQPVPAPGVEDAGDEDDEPEGDEESDD